MLEEVIHKLMMGLTPEDVMVAIEAGCGSEMQKLVDAMGWLAFRWWSASGEKNFETMQDVQTRLAALQAVLRPQR
jgi:hypothetical protein